MKRGNIHTSRSFNASLTWEGSSMAQVGDGARTAARAHAACSNAMGCSVKPVTTKARNSMFKVPFFHLNHRR